ncbi:hypothetical protein KSP40_PGU009422 [Platanthera guangdongensis]|uniref:Uncharacterized protein n=1 Tax=Platanthera guangdongensis TaxID=2320717 RepID=A0ABR2MPP9_9ASPA
MELHRIFFSSSLVQNAAGDRFLEDCSTRAEETMGSDSKHVTSVLFCGFDFPASHKYTLEYLKSHPNIKTGYTILTHSLVEEDLISILKLYAHVEMAYGFRASLLSVNHG